MNKTVKIYWVISVIFVLAGCATVSNEVSLKKISPSERLHVGRILVNFNGDTQAKCEVYVNHDLAPLMKLSQDGYVFYKTDRKEARFSRIACYDAANFYSAAWHHHKLNLAQLQRGETRDQVNYFGDIKIDWKIDRAATLAAAQEDHESQTPPKIGKVEDSGELKITVLSNPIDAEKELRSKVTSETPVQFQFKESLVSLKKDE